MHRTTLYIYAEDGSFILVCQVAAWDRVHNLAKFFANMPTARFVATVDSDGRMTWFERTADAYRVIDSPKEIAPWEPDAQHQAAP